MTMTNHPLDFYAQPSFMTDPSAHAEQPSYPLPETMALGFDELRSLYLRDMRLRVPPIVRRYDDVTFTFEDILKGESSLAKYL